MGSKNCSRCSWSDLTLGFGNKILSHMGYKKHAVFRSVCKSWGAAFHDREQDDGCPILFLLRGHGYGLFNPIYNSYQRLEEQPPRGKILCSNFGWLLMGGLGGSLSQDHTRNIFLYNIITRRERIDLPKCPLDLDHLNFSFSSPPTFSNDSCFVIRRKVGTICSLKVTNRADDNDDDDDEMKWNVEEIDFRRERSYPAFYIACNPIIHGGEWLCLDVSGWMAKFDHRDPRGSWRVFGKPFPFSGGGVHDDHHRVFLVQSSSDGDLFSATIRGQERERICVYKPLQWEWSTTTDLDLKNKMLFLSHAGSYVETTKFEARGNRIYFPRFQGGSGDDGILFYSLDTKKYHSFCRNIEFWSDHILFNATQSLYSAWIKPTI